MMPARSPHVYLITDRSVGGDLPARVTAALAGLPPGTAAVQLREKDLGGKIPADGSVRDQVDMRRTGGHHLAVSQRSMPQG
jgi:thiamine monophosphate synthase